MFILTDNIIHFPSHLVLLQRTDGKGRGRQVIGTARTCNMLLIVLDCMKTLQHKKIIENELDGVGIRLNQKRPDISFKKKDKVRTGREERSCALATCPYPCWTA